MNTVHYHEVLSRHQQAANRGNRKSISCLSPGENRVLSFPLRACIAYVISPYESVRQLLRTDCGLWSKVFLDTLRARQVATESARTFHDGDMDVEHDPPLWKVTNKALSGSLSLSQAHSPLNVNLRATSARIMLSRQPAASPHRDWYC